MRLAVRSRLGDWNSYQHFDLDLSDRSDFRGKRDRGLSLKATNSLRIYHGVINCVEIDNPNICYQCIVLSVIGK